MVNNYLQEKELVESILNQDEQAFFQFYNTYKDSIFQFINRQISDVTICEEVTQDVFIDFFEALRNFHYQSTVKTFLFAIAKYKVIDYIRKRKIKQIAFSALPSFWVDNLISVAFNDELEKKELTSKISTVFSHLPHDYQLVLRLKYIEGEHVKKISNKMQLGFKATESLIYRARKAFVKVFQEL